MLLLRLLARSGKAWFNDQASNWAAAIAFYTMLSAGPLLFVAVSTAGLVFGRQAASCAMQAQVRALMGPQAAAALAEMMGQAGQRPAGGLLATCLGLLTLTFGASGVFVALQDAMNSMWHVRLKKEAGFWASARKRFISASMVLALGFQLIVSLLLDAALSALWQRNDSAGRWWLAAGEATTSLVVATALLAATFRYLPATRLRWREALWGAAVTAMLLRIGKSGIGRYLVSSGLSTPFGAAGSLALLLTWVYYAAQVLLLGAAFTRQLSDAVGPGVVPDRDAEAVETLAVPRNGAQRRAEVPQDAQPSMGRRNPSG